MVQAETRRLVGSEMPKALQVVPRKETDMPGLFLCLRPGNIHVQVEARSPPSRRNRNPCRGGVRAGNKGPAKFDPGLHPLHVGFRHQPPR
jgi:hypothetical protein